MNKIWTEQEIEDLIWHYKFYGHIAFEIIGKKYNRSYNSIKSKFYRVKDKYDLSLKWYEKILKLLIKLKHMVLV